MEYSEIWPLERAVINDLLDRGETVPPLEDKCRHLMRLPRLHVFYQKGDGIGETEQENASWQYEVLRVRLFAPGEDAYMDHLQQVALRKGKPQQTSVGITRNSLSGDGGACDPTAFDDISAQAIEQLTAYALQENFEARFQSKRKVKPPLLKDFVVEFFNFAALATVLMSGERLDPAFKFTGRSGAESEWPRDKKLPLARVLFPHLDNKEIQYTENDLGEVVITGESMECVYRAGSLPDDYGRAVAGESLCVRYFSLDGERGWEQVHTVSSWEDTRVPRRISIGVHRFSTEDEEGSPEEFTEVFEQTYAPTVMRASERFNFYRFHGLRGTSITPELMGELAEDIVKFLELSQRMVGRTVSDDVVTRAKEYFGKVTMDIIGKVDSQYD